MFCRRGLYASCNSFVNLISSPSLWIYLCEIVPDATSKIQASMLSKSINDNKCSQELHKVYMRKHIIVYINRLLWYLKKMLGQRSYLLIFSEFKLQMCPDLNILLMNVSLYKLQLLARKQTTNLYWWEVTYEKTNKQTNEVYWSQQ